ncbi:hypothetical protein MHK_004847 [Candidatus Magnetomorum sp. HK-1]|nr:hypothetical protein MHK_004847 [Candidatus Magnetomorum sp. HK-1]
MEDYHSHALHENGHKITEPYAPFPTEDYMIGKKVGDHIIEGHKITEPYAPFPTEKEYLNSVKPDLRHKITEPYAPFPTLLQSVNSMHRWS